METEDLYYIIGGIVVLIIGVILTYVYFGKL